MKKIIRNMSTPESRDYWNKTKEIADEVAKRPQWMKAGIAVGKPGESYQIVVERSDELGHRHGEVTDEDLPSQLENAAPEQPLESTELEKMKEDLARALWTIERLENRLDELEQWARNQIPF